MTQSEIARSDVATPAQEPESSNRGANALRSDSNIAARRPGLLLVQSGRLREGMRWLDAAVEHKPDDALAQFRLGAAHLALGETAAALAALKAATQASPSWPEPWFILAQALRADGRPDEAIAALDHTLALAPQLAEAWLNKGNLLVARGDLTRALSAFDRAISARPTYAPAYFNRGNALRDCRRFDEAVTSYGQALASDPTFYAAAVNLANLYAHQKLWREADAAYRRAIELKPDEPEAWVNRGALLKASGDLKLAAEVLAHALSLRPDHVEAACHLGFTLRELGDATAAHQIFLAAFRRAPRHANCAHGLALTLRDLERPEDALKAFDAALAIDPGLMEAAINRSAFLTARGYTQIALSGLDRALSRAPSSAEAWAARGHTLFEMNDSEGAVTSHREALRINADLASARFGEVISHLRILYRDNLDMARSRANYAQALNRLSEWTSQTPPRDDVLRAAGQSQPFFLAYQNENDIELQRRYGALIRELVVRRFPDAPAPPLQPGEKIRVGFVSAFFRQHSNWKMPLRGWLEGLDRKNFEVFGYHLGKERDAETEFAAALCTRFVAGKRGLEDWRGEILSDRPHVLIYPGLLMDETSLLLAAQRLAPVQCNSWGHPETSGLPTLDYFLGSDAMDPPGAEALYTEALIRLPGLSIVYSPSPGPPATLQRADLGLREHSFVYWSGQTMMKYLPQYDDLFPQIAKLAPQAQFVFLAFPRAQEITEIFRRRLSRAFQTRGLDFERHCVIVGPYTNAEFKGAVRLCDAMLDTVGWSGCNSMLECVDANLPVVTLAGTFLRSRHGLAILRTLGDVAGIVTSQEDYVAEAVRLARDPDHFRKRKRKLREGRKRLLEGKKSVLAGLEHFLTVSAQRHCGDRTSPSI